MKFPKSYTLAEIASLVDCKYDGAQDHTITGINEIHVVENGDIVFVDHPKYYEKALNSAATTIIINKEVVPPAGKALIFSDDPFTTFNKITLHFSPKQVWHNGTDNKIDPSALIAPGVVLGHNIKIGARTVIHPNVTIYDNAIIGVDVEIHSNTVIGSHAFYYKKAEGQYTKMHSCGEVIIEDRVEIGAGCTVDKGVTGSTTIGEGTKIDNCVHIGHDTVIGKNCLVAAQVGIAGCVIMEDDITLWGQVGVRSDITIGKGAVVLAQSGISKGLGGGKTYFGSPVSESRDKLKEMANTRKIPGIIDDLRDIKKRLDES
ncbi:UDP-3-O-(3-hydroxymyristoyl)glucosamine N-acyltransferase [Cryomorpha ignava]|uniref:UDP-3-O-(3-hydroxymyristoyl)glucosamine N-acyltransferase n=1 Tax=Cryomorpha ignava TaxID=101383 RepID=A0A7K3WUW3_9FLAO|nr:LpxD N-terminal domain-containing protein [Cryomorpha ignava]NEN25469.1 UDP-3-O-(3-hydroxymyristoyl)glucosamine N-acyltransferase [Cryomorpha ignava]